MQEEFEVLPDPARMIEGLRDTGYEFKTAIADIIDNSIVAKATRVEVRAAMDYNGAIRVSIADNGLGMDRDALLEAMKYGSRRQADPFSLSKFGLGLKTASTAFSRRLSVTSRSQADQPLVQATWDLDHVCDTKKWALLISPPDQDSINDLERLAKGATGTVVSWDKVDRLLKAYQAPGGRAAQNALRKYMDTLKDHLGMVYQRFLDGKDDRARQLEIFVDGSKVEPWDPFCVGDAELVAQDSITVELPDGKEAEFAVRAYVLPRREEFPSEEAARRARVTNEMQGIYIYRENRLIHGPDWLDIFSKEPHGSLLRVEFSFDHRLDDAFRIDIKKSQIALSDDLWNWFADEFLPAPRRAADERYRKGQRKKAQQRAESSHDNSNASISAKEADLDTAKVKVLDQHSGDVEVTNREGKVRLKLKLGRATRPGEFFVQPVETIDDGVLWQPALIDGHKAVQINTGHPYYHKVYVPNLASGVTVQGMDSLLWALCAAELGTVNEATKRHFAELRFEVARLLRRLVEDLPEPDLDEHEAA